MKILVTGGAGFIASNVVDAYIGEGHTVVVVDNLITGKRDNLNPKATFYETDIRETAAIEKIFADEQPDVINHHAAQMDVRKSVTDPVYDAQVNILGSINLIECAKRYKAKKFIYVSTGGAVFGEPKRCPVPEDDPIDPLCPYGISKHTVEHYLSCYWKNDGLRYTVLRYPNIYGPRQDPHGEAGVVAIFSEQMIRGTQPTIFGDGGKTRDYVFVGDVVKANRMALTGGDNQIFNLGWGRQVSDFEIFDGVRTALGSTVEPIYAERRKGEIDHISLDATKAKELFGWEPTVTLAEGLKQATAYYKQKLGSKS